MDFKERFIRNNEATLITGLSRTSRWRKEKTGEFPQRYWISAGVTAYKLSELQEWIVRQAESGKKYKGVL